MEQPSQALTRRDFIRTTSTTAVAVLAAGGLGACSSPTVRGDFDLVLTGGLVYDGTAREPFPADLAITGDRITAVGPITGTAGRIIDVAGLVVAPGFIDVHTHCDETFRRVGARRYLAYVLPSFKGNYNYLTQGVTTVVTGNCGYGYTDTAAWLDMVTAVGFGTNVGHLAPHGLIREELFGRAPHPMLSQAELDRFRGRVAEEMDKGALGLSTGLAYAPGLSTPPDEIVALAQVLAHLDGVYTTHIRDEKGRPGVLDGQGVLAALTEAIDVNRQTGVSLEISHLKINAPLGDVRPEQLLDLIDRARAEGLDVHADQYPYAAGSTLLTVLLPPAFVTSDGVRAEYQTREGRQAVRAAITDVFTWLPPAKTLVTMDDEHRSHEGKTIAEIAEEEGRFPADAYVDMVCGDRPPLGVFFNQEPAVVRALMARDYVMTASDGWTVPKGMTRPHPRVYGTFPRKLRRFVLDDPVVDLPQAIFSMTGLPARKFHLAGRGEIAVGNFADLVVLDLNAIEDRATYTVPHRYATGVRHVLVNGVLALESGRPTGDRGGRALRRTIV